jgi:hypothetical protein
VLDGVAACFVGIIIIIIIIIIFNINVMRSRIMTPGLSTNIPEVLFK